MDILAPQSLQISFPPIQGENVQLDPLLPSTPPSIAQDPVFQHTAVASPNSKQPSSDQEQPRRSVASIDMTYATVRQSWMVEPWLSDHIQECRSSRHPPAPRSSLPDVNSHHSSSHGNSGSSVQSQQQQRHQSDSNILVWWGQVPPIVSDPHSCSRTDTFTFASFNTSRAALSTASSHYPPSPSPSPSPASRSRSRTTSASASYARASSELAQARHLFRDATLQHLPSTPNRATTTTTTRITANLGYLVHRLEGVRRKRMVKLVRPPPLPARTKKFTHDAIWLGSGVRNASSVFSDIDTIVPVPIVSKTPGTRPSLAAAAASSVNSFLMPNIAGRTRTQARSGLSVQQLVDEDEDSLSPPLSTGTDRGPGSECDTAASSPSALVPFDADAHADAGQTKDIVEVVPILDLHSQSQSQTSYSNNCFIADLHVPGQGAAGVVTVLNGQTTTTTRVIEMDLQLGGSVF
ncbi:hypothetical protein BKA62DRAFT_716805 [Auriculariales sp. MPI-PUGE-AT-0066]|nr:hypothetical protein BKA62DRAFT_716805 [Auriculariales sp. MPI-PUGE-AT-0066]